MKRRIPAYQLHKATGQAKVRIQGKDHYLGAYGSPESHDRYDALIDSLVLCETPTSHVTVTTLLAVFWKHCKRRYGRHGKGRLGGAQTWRSTIRLLRQTYGTLRAEDITPKMIKTMFIKAGTENDWARGYVNDCLNRIKRIYKWAHDEDLVSTKAMDTITGIGSFKRGDGIFRETPPIPPVPLPVVDATLPHLTTLVADMVRFQMLCGARPGEIVKLTVGEIDRTADTWIVDLEAHKTAHLEKDRRIYIGPRGQEIISKYLLKPADRLVFEYRPGKGYSTDSYRRAIQRACERHRIEKWAPNQLRHLAGTTVRAEFDLEHAQALLGHADIGSTQIYAERDERRAIEAAKKLG